LGNKKETYFCKQKEKREHEKETLRNILSQTEGQRKREIEQERNIPVFTDRRTTHT
jgi:hypothetical protein